VNWSNIWFMSRSWRERPWFFLCVLMVNAIIIIIIAWRRPTKGADLNREIRKDFQDAFNSLKYKSCVDTNNFYKYVFSIPIQLHDVNPSDEKVGSLRLELYNFINVFREGGFANYLEWRAPKYLGWQFRQDSFKDVRQTLERRYGTNQMFSTLSDSLEPFVHLESKGTMYKGFIDGVCIDSSLESLRKIRLNDWKPGISTNALLGIHVFDVKKNHPLLFPREDKAAGSPIISVKPDYLESQLLGNTISFSVNNPVFLFETPYTLEMEIKEYGSAITAYLYFSIMSSLDGKNGRPVIAQLHWVSEKKRWIWDYLQWSLPPPSIPPPVGDPATNYINSVF
jgi:hypothetical protein